MEKRKASLVDLHYDILKEILLRVARSSDGAKHFANAISICKAFQQFVEDVDVLRAVNFDNVFLSGRWEWFQLRGGLTCRCARSGQAQAQFILAKVILVSTSQLLKEETEPIDKEYESSSKDGNLSEKASDFLGNFLPDKPCPNFIGHHFDFVKIFLARAGCCEFIEMKLYIKNYMNYFIACIEQEHKRYKTMKHLVDSELCAIEHFYCIEKASRTKLFSSMRELCLVFANGNRLLGLKEEMLGTIEALCAEESEEVCYDDYITMVVAKLDIMLYQCRAMKVVSQHWLLVQDESTPNALLNELLNYLEEIAPLIEWDKGRALRMQEKRASIISTFHQLLKE